MWGNDRRIIHLNIVLVKPSAVWYNTNNKKADDMEFL